MSRIVRGKLVAALSLGGLLAGCVTPAPAPRPGEFGQRRGDEIVVCGRLVHTGAPVVLWLDPGGYDAYRLECRFTPEQERPSKPVSDSAARYSSLRRNLPEDVTQQVLESGWDLPLLQAHVDQFVYHYDVCGTSRRCFKVLQDMRGLSVHFMLDLDGTIYQTLDLKERAWHAGSANDRSIGIEIANMGAYDDLKTLEEWYDLDTEGRPHVTFPEKYGPTGIRTADFVARPARGDLIAGVINGRALAQYDLTDAQYESLIKLTAAVCRVLPRIKPDYPRDEHGRLRMGELTAEEMQAFSGLLGHWHVTSGKVDPGPAFDWERVVGGARLLLAQ